MEIKKLVLATRNKNKIKEITALLTEFPITIETLDAYPDAPDIEETGRTFQDNALLKAQGISNATGHWAFADDSGLEVDALNGEPGIYSARYAGEGCTYEDNNKKLIKAMEGIPFEKRTARFRCVIALVSPEKKLWKVEGSLEGFIALESCGTNGFGYDPVFFYPPKKKCLAEMSLEEKNEISHRGKALKNFIKVVQSIISS